MSFVLCADKFAASALFRASAATASESVFSLNLIRNVTFSSSLKFLVIECSSYLYRIVFELDSLKDW